MACNHDFEQKLQKYFDGEMTYKEETSLKHHLMSCVDCLVQFRELTEVEKQLRATEAISQTASFKDQILDQLPKESKPKKFAKTIKEHPIITACALFLVTLLTSAMIEFQSNDDVFVSDYQGVQVDGNHVVVPEGKIIHGDLTIENAIVEVQGQINGDLTLVNSELAQTSNNISGEIVQVNRFLRWAAIRLSREAVDFFQQFNYR